MDTRKVATKTVMTAWNLKTTIQEEEENERPKKFRRTEDESVSDKEPPQKLLKKCGNE